MITTRFFSSAALLAFVDDHSPVRQNNGENFQRRPDSGPKEP
jgi:hypothetical protein